MAEKASVTEHTWPVEERYSNFDDIAAQEAAEDQRVKSEQERTGGALQRYINAPSSIYFSFVLQCSWVATAISFQGSLLNGGPASLIYGGIFAGIGTTLAALSFAELASMDPTVGAQYRWSARFAPKWNRFFGLMQGWITVFAWIASCVSAPALSAYQVVGIAQFNNPSYEPQRWHVSLVMWALTIPPFVFNLWLPRVINILETAGAALHVLSFLGSILTLCITAKKSPAGYVFNALTHDVSGWTNPTVAWGLGLLTMTFPISGFDSVIHMTDEVKRARVQIPRSMVFSVVSNSIMQFLYMITVLFTLGDIEKVSASSMPFAEAMYQATGSRAVPTFFTVTFIFIIECAFFNTVASASRLVWAFSKDNGLPFSHIFAKVDPTLKMPLNALYLVGALAIIISLINIGSNVALNAFISLTALSLYISYLLPIGFILWRRISTKYPTPIAWGPFKLGRAGPFINAASLVYITFILIWMPMPTMLPVNQLNMNYAGPIVGGILLGAAFDWCLNGRKRFRIPIADH